MRLPEIVPHLPTHLTNFQHTQLCRRPGPGRSTKRETAMRPACEASFSESHVLVVCCTVMCLTHTTPRHPWFAAGWTKSGGRFVDLEAWWWVKLELGTRLTLCTVSPLTSSLVVGSVRRTQLTHFMQACTQPGGLLRPLSRKEHGASATLRADASPFGRQPHLQPYSPSRTP